MHHEWRRDEYVLRTDPAQLDVEAIHRFLAASYWARHVPLDLVRRSITHSLCFGIKRHDEQVGFARVITDRATFGYLADVFVVEAHRGRGLGHWLVECVLEHPELQGLRRWVLLTRDAHELYRSHGFVDLDADSAPRYMELRPVRGYPDPEAPSPAA
jgi:GNAT superfamily N-acetyltransferase